MWYPCTMAWTLNWRSVIAMLFMKYAHGYKYKYVLWLHAPKFYSLLTISSAALPIHFIVLYLLMELG